MNRHAVAVAVAGAALLAAALPACRSGGPGDGEARLEVDGTAVVSSHGKHEEITSGRTVRFGDKVEVTQGIARLELPSAVRLELRAATGDADNTIVTVEEVPVLDAGDLLVEADGSGQVEAGGTVVTVEDGGARVSRFLGMAVATYSGAASLDSAGQVRSVPTLRQMQVSTLGRPPQAVQPLDYESNDPWDRRFLGAAMDVGERLQRFADSYTSSLSPGEGRSVGFFEEVLPKLRDEADLPRLLDSSRPPGENLIGAAITSLGVSGSFPDRWGSVFRFRDEGAAWGLVALDQGVSESPLLRAVESAISASPFDFAPPRATTVTTTPTAAPSPTTTTSTTAPPSTPTTPTTEPPPPEPPPSSPLDPILAPLPPPVRDLLDGLLAG